MTESLIIRLIDEVVHNNGHWDIISIHSMIMYRSEMMKCINDQKEIRWIEKLEQKL